MIKFFDKNGLFLIHALSIFIICCLIIFVNIHQNFIYLLKTNMVAIRVNPTPSEIRNKRHILVHIYKYTMLFVLIEVLSLGLINQHFYQINTVISILVIDNVLHILQNVQMVEFYYSIHTSFLFITRWYKCL